MLVQASVTQEGKLINKSAIVALKEIAADVTANPGKAIKAGLTSTAKQLPMRAGMTGTIFAVIAGIGEAMGEEPLANVVPKSCQPSSPASNPQGFFAGTTEKAKIIELVDSKDDAPSSNASSKSK